MEWISDPTAWIGLGTLVVLELVLGIDNLIFIAILVDKLPSEQRNRARIFGLTLALLVRVAMLAGISWLQTLTTPLFAVMGIEFTVRSLILIAGGLFLLLKATSELHARLEGISAPASTAHTPALLWQVIVQIVILDAVFSIDSVITAVGMVDHLAIMVIAVVIAIGAMMFLSGALANFINAHSSVVILCLSFLLTIGFSLFVEGFGFRIPKGYLYTAIAFAMMIEGLNQAARRKQVERAAGRNLRARTTDAVLRILRGASAVAPSNEQLASLLAARNAVNVFAPAERAMVRGALSMAESPVGSIMTPSTKVTWLNESDDPEALSRKILQSGHEAYPVCRGSLNKLIGVARAPDLVRDLLEKKHIASVTIDRHPLTVFADDSVLQLVERAHDTRVPMAIVRDRSGAIIGVVTSIDLVRLILGRG